MVRFQSTFSCNIKEERGQRGRKRKRGKGFNAKGTQDSLEQRKMLRMAMHYVSVWPY